MEYGQRHLPLRQPNVIIGRGSDGDWVNDYNQPQLDLQESHTALEGFDAIAEYIESALEKFEDSADVQAGLVAIKLLHHYAEEFGELPEPLLWDMAMAVLQSSQPSEYIYQIMRGIKTASPALAKQINAADANAQLADLRPDDWHLIWPELAETARKAKPTQAA
jgi:hypothetical protein